MSENTTTLPSWLTALCVGDEIWWTAPDKGTDSGYYRIKDIGSESGKVETSLTVLTIENAQEQVGAFASEIAPHKPEMLHPVVICHPASTELLGFAESAEDARTLADERCCFVEVLGIALTAGVAMDNGSILAKAWVASVDESSNKARVQLVLNVTYDLNGESAAGMRAFLEDRCRHAIGNGMLSGDTMAEVDEYELRVSEVSETPSRVET